MQNCKIISLVLAKGGVGKTTGTVNIGTALHAQGYKVAVVDNDPQGSLSTALGHEPKAIRYSLATKMLNILDESDGPAIEECLIPSGCVNLLPANQKLGLIEKRLIMESAGLTFSDGEEFPAALVMRRVLEPLRKLYDFVLIDCSPSVGMLTTNALAASDSVLLPMEAHFLGFDAVKPTLDVIDRVKKSYNPDLTVMGILLNKYQDRTTLCRRIRDSVLETYGENLHVFTEPIAYSIKAAEQTAHGASIFEIDPKGKVALGYMAAAREVIAHG